MAVLVEIPTVEEISGLEGRDLDRALIALDEQSCGTSALIAAVIDRAEQTGHYLVDGHRSARAWAQATCNWSRATALTHLRVARLIRGNEGIGPELAAGRLGVPQVAELARLYANPRCGHLLVEALDVLVEAARTMRFEDFVELCRRWEAQADEDGARQDHRTAREGRRVRTGITGGSFTMSVDGDALDGAEIIEILDRFCDAEFLAEWDEVRARLGDTATKADMERSRAQRRFDALVTIFRVAAGANQAAPTTEPTVNVTVDLATFEQHLARFCGFDSVDDDQLDSDDRLENNCDLDGEERRDNHHPVLDDDEVLDVDLVDDVFDDGVYAEAGVLDGDGPDGDGAGGTGHAERESHGAAANDDDTAVASDPRRARGGAAGTCERCGPSSAEPGVSDRLAALRNARCETTRGHQVDPDDMIAAALVGRVRRVVLDGAGRVVDLGRRQRLFTGAAAEALRLSGRRCIWPGCCVEAARTQCDHIDPWAAARGPTSPTNGSLLCGHHNRFKSGGYRVWRDPDGNWHVYRPDGTEIAPLR